VPRKNGTRRAQLQGVLKQLARQGRSNPAIEAELKPVDVPLGMERLVDVFWSVNRARQEGQHGPRPISYTELKAFCELTDTPLTPNEVDAVMAMDDTFLKEVSELRNS